MNEPFNSLEIQDGKGYISFHIDIVSIIMCERS